MIFLEDKSFSGNLKYYLESLNKSHEIRGEEADEITNYIKDIDLLIDIEIKSSIPNVDIKNCALIRQPAVKYQACKGILDTIKGSSRINKRNFLQFNSRMFNFLDAYSEIEREKICNAILWAVKCKILEDIIFIDCLYYKSYFEDDEKFTVYL